MQRVDSLAIQIAARVTASVVVPNPDHPYLLAGPDLLLAEPGLLTALFIQRADEERNLDRLRTRLVLSILALPSHTTFAVMPRNDTFDDRSFDAVVASDDVAELELLARRGRARPRINLAQRQRAVSRVRADNPAQLGSGRRSDRLHERYWSAIRSSRSVDVSGDHLVSYADRLSRSAMISRLRSLMTISVSAEYTLDDGVVYEVDENLPQHELTVRTGPGESVSFDRGKPIRAAALAGWRISGPGYDSESERAFGVVDLEDLDDLDWDEP